MQKSLFYWLKQLEAWTGIAFIKQSINQQGYLSLACFVALLMLELPAEAQSNRIVQGKIESENQMYQIFKKYGGDFRINIEYHFKNRMLKYDLFANNIHVGYKYMSEKLVDILKEKQITGYDFVEAKNLFFEMDENG